MTLADWMLLNGMWIGLRTALSGRRHRRRLLLGMAGAAVALVLAAIHADVVSHRVLSVWWIASGLFLSLTAARHLLGATGTVFSELTEAVGTVLCLGLGTGLWTPLAVGAAIGMLAAVGLGHWSESWLDPIAAITLGAVGLNNLWAGLHGNLPAHHLSSLWALPWLIAGEICLLLGGGARATTATPRRPARQWLPPRGFEH